MQQTIRLAYCPTRRDVFSREEAIKFNSQIRAELEKLPAKIIDLSGINEEELLYRDEDIPTIIERFREEKADAIFLPANRGKGERSIRFRRCGLKIRA